MSDPRPVSEPERAYSPTPLGRGPAHELIARQLRAAIVSGELQPGARLPTEIELCEAFGVSRATIREALGSLVGQGLIAKARGLNGGSFVLPPSVDQASESLHLSLQRLGQSDGMTVAEIVESRYLLELPAARLAASRRTDDDIVELRACAHRVGTVDQPTPSDKRFHRAVAVASGNRLLQMAIEPINLVLGEQLDSSRYPDGLLDEIDHDHMAIADAIAAGDAEASEALMRDHLDALAAVINSIWKRPG